MRPMGALVNKALNLSPTGEIFAKWSNNMISATGRTVNVGLRWRTIYWNILECPAAATHKRPLVRSGDIRVLTIRIDDGDQAAVDRALQSAYRVMQPAEMLVVDVACLIGGRENLELQRDLISRALFEAGFDQPMIWAGRKLLEAENGLLDRQSSIAITGTWSWTLRRAGHSYAALCATEPTG